MKRLVAAAVCAVALVALSGCQTVNYETDEIQAERVVLNTYLDKDEYTVIGTAEGESDFVYWSRIDRAYLGDSEKYGYISGREDAFIGDKVYVGTGKKLLDKTEAEALRRARLNANYALIQKAYEMGGDEILEPIYTVEMHAADGLNTKKGYKYGTVKYKVTVRAKVIQLKLP